MHKTQGVCSKERGAVKGYAKYIHGIILVDILSVQNYCFNIVD